MRRFGLIGRPLGHSASAAYFAAKFAREGITDCAYELYELPEIGALARLLADVPELCGFNVTIPYKREVMPLLDELSHDARMIGAVNCVRRTLDGRLTGHNTDIIGLRRNMRWCWARAGLRRPYSMPLPSGEFRSTSYRAMRRKAITPTTICRAGWWNKAA